MSLGIKRDPRHIDNCRDAKEGDRLLVVSGVAMATSMGFVDDDDHSMTVLVPPKTLLSVNGIDDENCAVFGIPSNASGIEWTELGELRFPRMRNRPPRTVSLSMLVSGFTVSVERLPSATILQFAKS